MYSHLFSPLLTSSRLFSPLLASSRLFSPTPYIAPCSLQEPAKERTTEKVGPDDPDIAMMVLDDRHRKFVVADFSGRIGVFNCMNGSVMKSAYPFHDAVSGLHYVEDDKCIIATSWDRTLLILWEDDDDISDFNMPVLRSVHNAHAVDITTMWVTGGVGGEGSLR